MTHWTVDKARQTYNLANWSERYVDVNDQGHLVVRPYRQVERGEIDLYTLMADIRAQGLSLPVLVRFQDILRDRIDQLCGAFKQAFDRYQYAGDYTAVYPIKVNQQHSVVSEIVSHGQQCVGLEAGSKPELIAVLSLADANGGVIVCNGYKDREYIRLALIGKKLGHRLYIVIEKPSELSFILSEAEKLDVEPSIGLRIRLASLGKGKWQNTGGEKAKFGLSATQMMDIIKELTAAGKQHWVELLHFHMGSQIANLRDIKKGFAEATRYFVELRRHGMPVSVLDVGGGIGVDYDGTHSRGECSVNYTLNDYAEALVKEMSAACRQHDLMQPMIVTEAGRAMTAHHAVLITNVIGDEQQYDNEMHAPDEGAAKVVQNAWALLDRLERISPVEVYHDLTDHYETAQDEFVRGELSIDQRAEFERIYLTACHRIKKRLTHDSKSQRDLLDDLNEKLADKYFCNFSLFQSVPDIWGISQIFPIVPLQRLDEPPTRRAILQDLTCDSDGQINTYVDNYGLESTLPVHALQDNEDYLLGIFMVGAYQEILGDMHNLFGDTDAINVELDAQGGYRLCDAEHGDTILELLNYVHFDTGVILRNFNNKVEQAGLSDQQRQLFLAELKSGMEGYTYLEE